VNFLNKKIAKLRCGEKMCFTADSDSKDSGLGLSGLEYITVLVKC